MHSVEKTCRSCGRGFSGGETFCPEDGGRLATRSSDGAFQLGDDPLIGIVLDGRYRVRRVVGEGGMGIVYEAEHELIERRVALKVLRDDFSRRPDVVERFRREAKSASRIGHPNIVDVLDFGETPAGASYFVMEMLEGEDLADSLVRSGALPAERVVAIVVQCCRALAAAHGKGIIHRDLKPENIFLTDRDGLPDFVKIVDFGVAKMAELETGAQSSSRRKLTRTGMVFGTPEYMSPEQAQGQPPDHRVDVYALGIILFELLTGRVPFEGESFMSVLSKHARHRVPALRDVSPTLVVSPQLEAIVYRALEKVPDARFATMSEMADALIAVPEMPEPAFRTSLSGVVAPTVGIANSGGDMDDAPTTELRASDLDPKPTGSMPFDDDLPVVPRRRGLLAALGAALVVLSVVALMLASPDELPPAASAADAIEGGTDAEDAPGPADGAGVRPAPAEASIEAQAAGDTVAAGGAPAEELVSVAVTTRPGGASVHRVDGGLLCASTPCRFDARRGEPLALIARSGPRRARTTVQPVNDTKLHLVLLAPGSAPAMAGPELKGPLTPGRPPRAQRAAVPGDLKVPAAFRD